MLKAFFSFLYLHIPKWLISCFSAGLTDYSIPFGKSKKNFKSLFTNGKKRGIITTANK